MTAFAAQGRRQIIVDGRPAAGLGCTHSRRALCERRRNGRDAHSDRSLSATRTWVRSIRAPSHSSSFLSSHRPGYLYLVGDVIDGWRLRRRWHWEPVYSRIVRRLISLARSGCRIYYTPGNHDEFLRDFLYDLGLFELSNAFVHQAADGRRLLVTHGDLFDQVEQRARWLSVIGSVGYDLLLAVNCAVHYLTLRRRKSTRYGLCDAVKRRVKGRRPAH